LREGGGCIGSLRDTRGASEGYVTPQNVLKPWGRLRGRAHWAAVTQTLTNRTAH
jgi:hypothetical protein